ISPIYSRDAVRSTFRRNHRQFFSTGLLGIAASAFRPPVPLPPSNITTDQDFEIPVDCSGRKPQTRFFDEKDRGEHPLLGIAASAFRPPVPLPPSNITTDQDFEIPVDCSGRKPQTRFFDEKDRGEHPVLRRLQLFFSSQYHKTNTLTTRV
ncbi:hypothetical protein DY000_02051043, partial [Brassica cretica]